MERLRYYNRAEILKHNQAVTNVLNAICNYTVDDNLVFALIKDKKIIIDRTKPVLHTHCLVLGKVNKQRLFKDAEKLNNIYTKSVA
ncbi:hypothetical protein [Cysteiniphilum marinum]|uniref:hypothetical protein n=1 Tax=Cysteiniphilum marinum TaxID=2774191 RepID=UPI00193AEBAD|nr:hypothetical protein [Cysteiniphilum marinum]